MIRLAALAILALSACAAAPAIEAQAPRCDVTLKFASYGAGIDRELADKVAAAVKADHDVARSERKPWGREGEFDQCLTAKSGRDVKAMFERYRAMLPAKSLKAPTSIEGPDGLRFETIGPM
ncbi:hypothetical protein [Caulobacter sp. 1776]|uniref:hypothetical protein n=1 Tax=Caulobacter sp. 1776 TaxID=3156420 RepID=UPI003392C1E4